MVTHVGVPFACEYELITRRTRWEETRRIAPTESERGGVGDTLHAAQYSSDARLIVMACGNDVHGGAVFLWDRHTEATIMVCRVNQSVLSACFCMHGPKGKERIVTGAADGIVRAFEQVDDSNHRYRLLWTHAGHLKRVTECAMSPSGRTLVTCSTDGVAQVFSCEPRTAGVKVSTTLDHDVTQYHGITGARMRADDGAASFITCCDDRRVRLFDRDSGMLLAESTAVTEPLRAVCFASDGKAAIAGGSGGTL